MSFQISGEIVVVLVFVIGMIFMVSALIMIIKTGLNDMCNGGNFFEQFLNPLPITTFLSGILGLFFFVTGISLLL